MTISVGADPEFFVRHKNHYVSAHIFNCGTKRKPMKTPHGYAQVDGIALECNVTPATTREEFVRNMSGAMADLNNIVAGVDPTMTVLAKPSIFFGHKKLEKVPYENFILGCQPDYNGYSGKANKPPNADLPIRTASGHVHIGWTSNENIRQMDFFNQCCKMARQLDYFLGLPSLLWDDDTRRRTLYGKAGAFRPKSYGMEYRVLSNAWCRTETMTGWVFDRTVAAVKAYQEGNIMEARFGNMAQVAIDTNDAKWHQKSPELAKELLV